MKINWSKSDFIIEMILKTGGWSGIRTHEKRKPLPVFKTGAFNRSAIHPRFLYHENNQLDQPFLIKTYYFLRKIYDKLFFFMTPNDSITLGKKSFNT